MVYPLKLNNIKAGC